MVEMRVSGWAGEALHEVQWDWSRAKHCCAGCVLPSLLAPQGKVPHEMGEGRQTRPQVADMEPQRVKGLMLGVGSFPGQVSPLNSLWHSPGAEGQDSRLIHNGNTVQGTYRPLNTRLNFLWGSGAHHMLCKVHAWPPCLYLIWVPSMEGLYFFGHWSSS